MAGINLGTIANRNGKLGASGIASGLDSNALIDGILAGRQSGVDALKDKVEVNGKKITALDQLYLKVDRFKTSLNLLREEPGVGNKQNFLFNYRTASVGTNNGASAESYLTVTASPGAAVGSYEISDVTRAKAHTLTATGFRSRNESVVSGATVASTFTVTKAATVTGSVLDSAAPLAVTKGYDAAVAPTKASLNVTFANNQFEAGDTFSVGGAGVTFGTDVTAGATLADTLGALANFLNTNATGDAAGYSYTVTGGNTLTLTRNAPGALADVGGGSLAVSADFSGGADQTQTVQIGSGAASNGAVTGTVLGAGTDGTSYTQTTDALTTFTPTLAGGLSDMTAVYTAGSAPDAAGFTANKVKFTVKVGGETYASQEVSLGGGALDTDLNGTGDGGAGLSGFGAKLEAGTKLIFTKVVDTETRTAGSKDASFVVTTGDAAVINDSAGATAFAASIQGYLDDNDVTVVRDFNSGSTDAGDLDSTSTAVGFRAGTFTLGGVSLTLEEGDSLNDIRSKINSVSSLSGVKAEILKVDDENYTLQLQSATTGAANLIDEFASGGFSDGTLGSLTLGGANAAFKQTQAGADASFLFNGTRVTRGSNTIDDLVENVTLKLKGDTPDTSVKITADISPDVDAVHDGVADMLNTYNDIKFFVAKQSLKDTDGSYLKDSVLGGESVLDDVMRKITDDVTSVVTGLSGGTTTLFNVGIDFKDYPGDDTLPATQDIFTMDSETFKSKLSANFDEVRKLFAYDLTADSSTLSVFSRTNNPSLTSFKLDIDDSRADGQKVRVLNSSGSFLFYADYTRQLDRFGNPVTDGGKIAGKDGTALEGLELVYTGDGTDLITVTATQGLADRAYNTVSGMTASDVGTLAKTANDWKSENKSSDDKMTREKDLLKEERERLIGKFARLEQAVTEANNVLAMFEAQRNANN